jgi:hypothetical protein
VFHHNKQYITPQFFPHPWSHASKTKSKWFFSGPFIHFLVSRTFRLPHDHNIPHFLNFISLPQAPSLRFFPLSFVSRTFHSSTRPRPPIVSLFFLKVIRKSFTVLLYLLNLEYFDHSYQFFSLFSTSPHTSITETQHKKEKNGFFQREQITHGDDA